MKTYKLQITDEYGSIRVEIVQALSENGAMSILELSSGECIESVVEVS